MGNKLAAPNSQLYRGIVKYLLNFYTVVEGIKISIFLSTPPEIHTVKELLQYHLLTVHLRYKVSLYGTLCLLY